MSIWWLLFAIACLILGGRIGWRIWQQYDRQRRTQRRRSLQSQRTVRVNGVRGRHYGSIPPRKRHQLTARLRSEIESRGNLGKVIFFLMIVATLLFGIFLLRGLNVPTQHPNLVVAIAPFADPDGTFTANGQSVSQELIAAWSTGTEHRLTRPLELIQLNERIDSPQVAYEVLRRENADVVIWGVVEPGAVANASSLRPTLLWAPRNPLPIATTLTYRERVVMPLVYELASTPINGQTFLGPLFDILDLYQTASYDQALQAINAHLARYAGTPGARVDILYGLRSLIALEQDQLAAAISDLESAIAISSQPEYWNNLGVALISQRRFDEALQALGAAQLQGGEGLLAAAHLNRGLALLILEEPLAALPDLQQAHALNPVGIATLVALAEGHRGANAFPEAQAAIDRALSIAPEDPLVQLEAARLSLARLVGQGSHTDWELWIRPPLDKEALISLRETLDAQILALESQVLRERQRAAAADAAGLTESGRVFEGSVRHIDTLLFDLRFWRTVLLTEEGVASSQEQVGMLRRIYNTLFGDDPPAQRARQDLLAMSQEYESSYDVQMQLGRVYWLLSDPRNAREHFARATEIDPAKPEGWYGLALVWQQTDPPGTERDARIRDALARAIANAPAFAPAYLELARFEMEQQQWAAALPSLQWLVAERPDRRDAAVSLGRTLRELGRFEEAEAALLPLANDHYAPALVELARVYSQTGFVDVAEDLLRRSLALNPDYAVAAYELGRLLQDQQNYAGAEAAYQRAITIRSDYLEAHIALGQLYGRVLNQPQRAVESYERAIAVGGTDARNYENLGREFFEIGEYGEAISALQQSILLNPNVPEVHHLLAQAYLEQGRYDAAREAERAAIARTADGIYLDAQIGIAESFRRQGRFDEAVSAYNEVLDVDPNAIGAFVGLGRTAADQGDLQMAIGYYNQALARDANDVDAHFWLGQALIDQGFFSRALDEFKLVLASDDTNVRAYYGAGRAYARMAEGALATDPALAASYDAEARAMLDAAIQRNANFGPAYLERGILNERQERLQDALNDYSRATELLPSNATAPFLSGKVLLRVNNVESATEFLEEAVRRNDQDPQALYWLARAYRAQNDTSRAIRTLERTLEYNAGYIEARYYLGLTYEESNRLDEAAATYTTLIGQTPPDDRWRLLAEERLRDIEARR